MPLPACRDLPLSLGHLGLGYVPALCQGPHSSNEASPLPPRAPKTPSLTFTTTKVEYFRPNCQACIIQCRVPSTRTAKELQPPQALRPYANPLPTVRHYSVQVHQRKYLILNRLSLGCTPTGDDHDVVAVVLTAGAAVSVGSLSKDQENSRRNSEQLLHQRGPA